jgi:predicted negative regulator of RcsB-dependent stress response
MAEEYLTDDEQWEAIKRGIAENGLWVIAGVALGVALLFGWRYYENHQNEVALQAAGQFRDMSAAVELNDHSKARQVADGIIRKFPTSPYADQARLTLARLSLDDGQLPSAIASLTDVMNTSKDAELKHIARLRLARVLTDQGKPDEAIKLLNADAPGGVASGPFAARYHEVRGDAYYAKKDFKNAVNEYRAALGAGDSSGVNAALLELKIADLGEPSTPATAMAPTLPSPNKANP